MTGGKSYLKLSLNDLKNLPVPAQIKALEYLIHYHNEKYFLDNNPEISDTDFDELTKILEKLKPESAVLNELVGELGSVVHKKRMLSIEKKYTFEDVKKWVEDIDDNEFLVEPKYDGMAARLDNGVLATRGDGYKGENITHRLKDLKVIGHISNNGLYEGEITIPLSYFNEKLAAEYKNPRNAGVGIVKAKQQSASGIKAVKERGVHFVIYDQNVSLIATKDDLTDLENFNALLQKVLQTDYPLDGVVIKAKNLELRQKLGATEHHYRWQIAYKFPAERKWSKVISITDQVGRTGRITSVANIEPIQLSGATVTNVTLHNADFIRKSKIDIGSKIEVCRSGEVIPFILQVKPNKLKNRIYHLPTHCPICATKLVETEKYIECPNDNCPARKSQSIEYFFKVLGVDELGLKTIEKFMAEFKVKNVLDFYHLDKEKISNLDGFGEKSANKIIKNVEATLHQNITENELLQALGIKEIGPATSKWIISHFGFEKLFRLDLDALQTIPGIGPRKAESFLNQIQKAKPIVDKLLKMGLEFKKENKTNKLAGLKFCITGKKEQYSREELIEIIEKNGGEYKSSVTKDLDYLIAGDDAGSKLTKAKELDVKVINEKEFLGLTA